MPDDPKPVWIFGNSVFREDHTAILQALNRWMQYENMKIYLDAEEFKKSEEDWSNVPVIFAQLHPEDFNEVTTDLQSALLKLSTYEGKPAKTVGYIEGSHVEIPGQPRLESKVVFTDPEVETLYSQGKLSLSTGFRATIETDGKLTAIVPNHLLVFFQDDQNQPRDKGAMFLNSLQGDQMPDAQIGNAGRVISEKNKNRFKSVLDALNGLFSDMCSDEDKTAMENKDQMIADLTLANKAIEDRDLEIKNKDGEITALKETLAKKDGEILNLTNRVNAIEQETKDKAWVELKNKIPPGLVDTPEKEKELRLLAESDALAFGNKIASLKMAEATQEEGETHPAPRKDAPIINKGIGAWDAKTMSYKEI